MAIHWRGERHDVLDSTNRAAIERIHACWAQGESSEGVFITANRQTAGRGQHGRTWESPEGGLYVSAIVEEVPAEARPLLPLLAGVAVISGLQIEGHTTALRWPNDVVLDGKKVAGVLCESVAQGSRWASVIGIGVNVNVPVESLPPPMRLTATSLHLYSQKAEATELVLAGLLFALDSLLTQAKTEGIASVVNRAQELDSLAGKSVDFRIDDRLLTGIASGLSDRGHLLIRINNHTEAFPRGTILAIDGLPIRMQ